MKNNFARLLKTVNTQSLSAGFTLIELLVAMSLTLIVTSLSGFGLVAMMTSNSKAEAKTQRRTEINRALDFISDEVRMSRKINTNTNTTTTASAAVVTSNTLLPFKPLNPSNPLPEINLTSTSDLAKIVLYLEIPLTPITTLKCPAGGPNANSSPPEPSTYDRVVYYILSDSSSTWLGPRVIKRYGRAPEIDGTINPCSTPGPESETFIDSISTNTNTSYIPASSCPSPAIPSGTEGFYACVNERKVNLYLRSKVSNTAPEDENSKTTASSRVLVP